MDRKKKESVTFHEGTKKIFKGFHLYESLNFLDRKGQVLPNDFKFLNNKIDLNKYKVIIVPSIQEYLSLEFLNKLRSYVQNGGRLIILGIEFAFRRIRSTEDSLSYYVEPQFDPLFNIDKKSVASDFPSQVVIRDYFGHAVEYGISFGFTSEGREFQIFEKGHPLIKIFETYKPKIRNNWMPGAIIEKDEKDRFCVKTKAFSCKDQIVLGRIYFDNKEKKTCCDNQPKFDLLYDGKSNNIQKKVNQELSMPVYYARMGKGHLFVAPSASFFRGGVFSDWYPEFLKFTE